MLYEVITQRLVHPRKVLAPGKDHRNPDRELLRKPMQTYTLRIGSLIRELPVVPVSQELSIASFVMLGDTSLVEAAADALFAHPRFPRSGIDLLVCPA